MDFLLHTKINAILLNQIALATALAPGGVRAYFTPQEAHRLDILEVVKKRAERAIYEGKGETE